MHYQVAVSHTNPIRRNMMVIVMAIAKTVRRTMDTGMDVGIMDTIICGDVNLEEIREAVVWIDVR